jgi:hypothetical protein
VNATTLPITGIHDLGTRLESLLQALTNLYTNLLDAAARHKDAMRRADPRAIETCLADQNQILEHIAEHERQRQTLVNSAMQVVTLPRTNRAITLTDLAQHLPEPSRSVVLRLAAALRELMAEAQRQHATLKAAASSLISHMEGLIRQVGRQLSHAGTYTRRGHVEAPVPVTTSLDLRS